MLNDANIYSINDVQEMIHYERSSESQKQSMSPDDANDNSTDSDSDNDNKSGTKYSMALDLKKFVSYLKGIYARSSSSRCAQSIRIGLQTAGAKFNTHPVAAADWGKTLQEIGYKKIEPEFEHPHKGDIYIINRTAKHRYGHIAAFNGQEWISDYRQHSHVVYGNSNVTYSYFRL